MTLPRLSLAVLLLRLASDAAATVEPEPILLWPNGAPGSEARSGPEAVRLTDLGEHIVSNIHRPSITPYLPEAATSTGVAVVVIPGGGHRELWMDHEGYRVGRWLRDHGIAAFVLKYRLAREAGSSYTVEGNALADVQRAIRLVRSRSAEWHLSSDRIGVMGFSAGGELAVLAGTRYQAATPSPGDPIDRESAKPAFMGLVYPSIPAGLHLSKDTPPAFLLCGENDSPAISNGVPTLYDSLRRAGGSAEMHVLTGVGHGFGIRETNPPAVAAWPSMFYDWLEARQLLAAPPENPSLTPQMRDGIANARPVPVYSAAERARAAQKVFGLAALPSLGASVALTPNAPAGTGGAHLSFWKPSFVLGTPGGGEAGVNFWGIHNEGHVNVGFMAAAESYVLDCRLLSAGVITYKVFRGATESPGEHGETALSDNHLILRVPAPRRGEMVSVELWPTPVTEPMGFLGCDLSEDSK